MLHRDGLQFGRYTTSNIQLTAARRGKWRHERYDTPTTRRQPASNAAKPPPQPPEVRRVAHKAWAQCRLARENAEFGVFWEHRANFFVHEARQHGDIETNNTTAHPKQGTAETGITSAPEKCTKNTHFAPAKAMTVSTDPPHRPAKATPVSVEARSAPAKAMVVSDRPTWPTGPDCGARGRRQGLIGTYSHAIPPHTLHALKCNR